MGAQDWTLVLCLALSLLLTGLVQAADDHIFPVDHEGWLDCIGHGAIRFRYNAQYDTGNNPRDGTHRFDPDAPPECQQLNTDTYHTEDPTAIYQRGHLVPANHLDYSEGAIRQSN